ncbi:MAG: VCBS repeat-containing protein [Chitinivibrionales bacterium]|nr:VCBS repeat-containing protein [Chitinivibrionales bacterium]
MTGRGAAFIDVDQDSVVDVVAGEVVKSGSDNRLLFYRNESTPTDTLLSFSDPVALQDSAGNNLIFTSQPWPTAMDWDGDGDRDLLVAMQNGTIQLVLCEDPGVAGYSQGPLISTIEQSPFNICHTIGGGTITNSLTVIDADRDGLNDIIVGDVSDRIWFLQNIGTAKMPVFTGRPLNVSRTTAAFLEIVNSRCVRLYFSLPTTAGMTKVFFQDNAGATSSAMVEKDSPTDVSIPEEVIHGGMQQFTVQPLQNALKVRFHASEKGIVQLNLFSSSGRMISRLYAGCVESGHHELTVDRGVISCGVWYISLQTARSIQCRKIALLR